MDNSSQGKKFIITDDLSVYVNHKQLNTRIYIANRDFDRPYAFFDIEKWTQFLQTINAIDKEFRERFNSQTSS